jgi:hypothetical protein
LCDALDVTHARTVGAILIVALSMCGCGKSPERVCDKFSALMRGAKDGGYKVDDRAVCIQQMTEMRTKDPAGYDCTADCVLGANDVAGATSCISRCPEPM